MLQPDGPTDLFLPRGEKRMKKRLLFLTGWCLVGILVPTRSLVAEESYHLIFSTYLGDPANDNGRSGFLGRDGSLYVTGSSDGPGWPGQAVTAAIPQPGVLTVYGKPALPDKQPPSAPTNLAAQETTPGKIGLAAIVIAFLRTARGS
jgi:hypothetical protein